MRWSSKASSLALLVLLTAGAAAAGELSLTAKVDRKTVNLGDTFTLTLTLTGDIEQATVPPVQLPDGLAIAARSEENQLVFNEGKPSRTVNLLFVIIAQRPGPYRLGPFAVTVKGQNHPTDPIDITVVKPTVPPNLPRGDRVTI